MCCARWWCTTRKPAPHSCEFACGGGWAGDAFRRWAQLMHLQLNLSVWPALACGSMLTARHCHWHPLCRDVLVPLVLKSVRNLRSSLCKVSEGRWKAWRCVRRACICVTTAGRWALVLDDVLPAPAGLTPLWPLLLPANPIASCQTAIMAVADLFQQYGDALLPHTDVGGQAKPLTSLLAQVRR